MFADRICQLCASDLNVFSNLRDDLISKQNSLYQLAGLELNVTSDCPVDETDLPQDDNSDYEMSFEAIEPDDDNIDEYVEEFEVNEEMYEEEDATAAETIVKIEKLDEGDDGNDKIDVEQGATSLDYFEEIVETDFDDKKSESDDRTVM